MPTRQYLQRLVDLTQPDPNCLVPAEVNQAFDTAQPETDIGFFVISATAPDVITYPALKGFHWLELAGGQLNGNEYYFDGINWVLSNLADGAKILDGTITISKFSTNGASAFDIIQVNSDASGYQFTSVVGAIPVDGVPFNRLKASGVTDGFILGVQGGVVTAFALDSAAIIAKLLDNSIPLAKLIKSATGKQVVAMSDDAATVLWRNVVDLLADNSIPLAKLVLGVGNGGKFIRQNAAGDAFEYVSLQYTLTTVVTSDKFDVPAAGLQQLFAHGKGVYPFQWQALFECIEVNNGYSIGDRIDHSEVSTGGGTDEHPAFVAAVNKSNITLTQVVSGPSQRNFIAKDDGSYVDFAAVVGKWKLDFVLTFTT